LFVGSTMLQTSAYMKAKSGNMIELTESYVTYSGVAIAS
jgi:hypothetical protein